MDGSPLEATVEVIPGGALVLLAGRIDRDAAASLNAAYATASAAGSVVTLDFAATDYINSTGIALIVGVLAEARRDGRQIVARAKWAKLGRQPAKLRDLLIRRHDPH